ncbi:MAG: cobalt ECF transporter T component CbiQ [Ardenticatenaceae bacterium]|nr:cobalt ECF transporter T component CbiQ [Anaerolineales bacterium]MCB8923654.1 cobalt ECF transporter T component CbiQ [Ardenticatenaceae bacterium]MCB8991873.1 cobalt ECF transporter T component CbiQ [Ardenticatenaceae bacterium]MCB9005160.1 cobalt ECF transporter T component CbiQ [Ardenticatenaceae bacterium]
MHVSTFDRYEQRSSAVHQLDPRVKVVLTLLFIVSNVALPDGAWWAFAAGWALLLLVNRAAHFSFGYLFKRSFIALPFALAAVTVLFTLPGTAVASWQIGSHTLTVSDAGLMRFASILIRSWLSVQMAILLTATTQFPDLMHALHHLRVPQVLVSIISFMYRYLFVLADEVIRLLRARDARSARLTTDGKLGGTIWWRAKVTGSMAGQLFVRSFDRSDRVYNAMLSRGYRGHLLTMNPHVMNGRDWLMAGVGTAVLVIIQLLGWLT